jgi:HNH endonuclease
VLAMKRTLEATYVEIERLFPVGKVAGQILMRALSVAGAGVELRCAMPTCFQESRYVFEPSRAEDYRRNPAGSRKRKVPHVGQLSIDHVIPSAKGGSHRPDNLRFAHWGCNHRAGARG